MMPEDEKGETAVNERNKLIKLLLRFPSDTKLVVNLQPHSGCNESKLSDLPRMPCLSSVPKHPTLRRQNAILATQELPPPEVRIIRMCLTKRTTDVKEKPTADQCKYSPSPSPTRMKSQKKNKKKKGHRKEAKDNESSLSPSVSSGRALGAQVHPLMAVLMSPRTTTVSFNSDSLSGDEESEETDRKAAENRAPQLTITSLQLPDYAAKHTYSHKNSLPPRRVRTGLRRTPRAGSLSSSGSLTCSGSTLAKDK